MPQGQLKVCKVAGDGVALPRTACRRGHTHATNRLRKGGAAEDALHLALALRCERPCLYVDTPWKCGILRSLARV